MINRATKRSNTANPLPKMRIENEQSFYQNPQAPRVEAKEPPLPVVTAEPKARRDKNRLQINFSPEAERKMYELIERVSAQGPKKDVTVSELIISIKFLS